MDSRDKGKYHRVIKTLMKYERQELAKKEAEAVVEETVFIYEYENTWRKQVIENPIVTIGLPVIVGAIAYAIFR